MPKEIKCPKCGNPNMEKKIRKIAVGSGRGPRGNKYPPEEEYTFYECRNCEREFIEDDIVK